MVVSSLRDIGPTACLPATIEVLLVLCRSILHNAEEVGVATRTISPIAKALGLATPLLHPTSVLITSPAHLFNRT